MGDSTGHKPLWTTGGHYITVLDARMNNGVEEYYVQDPGGRHNDGWFKWADFEGYVRNFWTASEPVLEKKDSGGTHMTQIKGIDISYAQGKLTKSNFDSIKASGIDFVIVRIGYTGTSSRKCSIDSTFESNYANALAAGLKIGAYYYSTATNTTMAKKEAEYCIAQLKGKHITYPVYIDVEDTVY